MQKITNSRNILINLGYNEWFSRDPRKTARIETKTARINCQQYSISKFEEKIVIKPPNFDGFRCLIYVFDEESPKNFNCVIKIIE